jgi:hypothetical protein
MMYMEKHDFAVTSVTACPGRPNPTHTAAHPVRDFGMVDVSKGVSQRPFRVVHSCLQLAVGAQRCHPICTLHARDSCGALPGAC